MVYMTTKLVKAVISDSKHPFIVYCKGVGETVVAVHDFVCQFWFRHYDLYGLIWMGRSDLFWIQWTALVFF